MRCSTCDKPMIEAELVSAHRNPFEPDAFWCDLCWIRWERDTWKYNFESVKQNLVLLQDRAEKCVKTLKKIIEITREPWWVVEVSPGPCAGYSHCIQRVGEIAQEGLVLIDDAS